MIQAKTTTEHNGDEKEVVFNDFTDLQDILDTIGEDTVVRLVRNLQRQGAVGAFKRSGEEAALNYQVGRRTAGTGQKAKAAFAEQVLAAAQGDEALHAQLKELAAKAGLDGLLS